MVSKGPLDLINHLYKDVSEVMVAARYMIKLLKVKHNRAWSLGVVTAKYIEQFYIPMVYHQVFAPINGTSL